MLSDAQIAVIKSRAKEVYASYEDGIQDSHCLADNKLVGASEMRVHYHEMRGREALGREFFAEGGDLEKLIFEINRMRALLGWR